MKAEKLADAEWRKICSAYEHYTSEDYLALYELFIDAFVKGYKSKGGNYDGIQKPRSVSHTL